MTFIYAHRGASAHHPENTMEAFKYAAIYGADGIELDVQLSKDGHLMVMHDPTVNRTTNGRGKVKDLTLQQLKSLQVGKHRGHLKDREIPTLVEVFDWMKTNQLHCNIELKTNKITYEDIEAKLVQLIVDYHFLERVVLSSFNHYSIIVCRNLCPALEIAPLYSNGLFEPWAYAASIGASGIHPKLSVVPLSILQQALNEGIAVRPYTVNRTKDMLKLFDLNCTAFITDEPQKAVSLRNYRNL